MKKKLLCKHKKRSGSLGVVLYTSEGEINRGCSWDVDCNTETFCGTGDKTPDGVNVRCNPPESTKPGSRNFHCNLVANC